MKWPHLENPVSVPRFSKGGARPSLHRRLGVQARAFAARHDRACRHHEHQRHRCGKVRDSLGIERRRGRLGRAAGRDSGTGCVPLLQRPGAREGPGRKLVRIPCRPIPADRLGLVRAERSGTRHRRVACDSLRGEKARDVSSARVWWALQDSNRKRKRPQKHRNPH